MIFLILSILSSTAIFIIFKYLDKFSIPTIPVIVYNYLFASIPGYILAREKISYNTLFHSTWLPLAIFIGILFIVMFYVIGLSSQKAGISITTVASKMSVAIPITFSIFYDPSDRFTYIKLVGIILAMLAVFLIVYRKKAMRVEKGIIFLPFLLFLGMGMVDTLVKYAQFTYISDSEAAFFTAILFLISFLTGFIYIIFRKSGLRSMFNQKVFLWGVILGVVNFGSIFFLLRALNYRAAAGHGIDSSVVFAVNNTGIVMFSVLSGLLLFREKLNRLNWFGIALSLIAIFIFSVA